MEDKIIGGTILTAMLGWFGWQSRSIHRKVGEFPEKYVMKVDYKTDVKDFREEMRGIRQDNKTGMERIHDRIDAIAKGGKK